MIGDFFRMIAAAADPENRIRRMSDGHLSAAIDELGALEQPNAWQAEAYAMAIREGARRFQATTPDEFLEE